MGERAFFLIGYGKNDRGNIGDATTVALRTLAKNLQALTEDGLEDEKAGGRLREIER